MKKPNFLVAGVAKCGTTSLFYYLEQHPEICIPKKETFFFIADRYKNPSTHERGRRDPSRIIFDPTEYDSIYERCTEKGIGEISTCYAYYYKEAIPRIKEKLGDPRIIIIIRQPVERLISGYKHFLRMNREHLSLQEALNEEKKRETDRWDFMWQYRGVGFYADAIEAYQKSFSHVKVILQEDLTNKPDECLKELFQFIGVDDQYTPDTSIKYNISDPQSNNKWTNIFLRIKKLKALLKPFTKKNNSDKTKSKIKHRFRKPNQDDMFKASSELQNELLEIYKEDIKRVEKLIQRNLSHWLIKK
ncbi:MAG: sulfotransferase [Bacteroidetes bacterium]|nr:sulfotransferase [Bacteroidota bacterium]